MIKILFSKLKKGNLEITEKMLNDILSYMKRQENYIKQLRQENKKLNNIRQEALHLVFHNDIMDYRVFEESLKEILKGNIALNYGYTDEFINSILSRYDKIKELCNNIDEQKAINKKLQVHINYLNKNIDGLIDIIASTLDAAVVEKIYKIKINDLKVWLKENMKECDKDVSSKEL